jgi:hypothetical protein
MTPNAGTKHSELIEEHSKVELHCWLSALVALAMHCLTLLYFAKHVALLAHIESVEQFPPSDTEPRATQLQPVAAGKPEQLVD